MIVGIDADLSMLTLAERREIRNFQRYLRLLPRHRLRMLQRPRWQRYLGVTQQEAWLVSKSHSKRLEKGNG